MHGILLAKAAVDAVEDILFIALVVKDLELWWIEKSAGIQAVDLDEVAPVLPSVTQINRPRGRAEGAIRGADASRWGGRALARARRHLDDQRRLAAILRRR